MRPLTSNRLHFIALGLASLLILACAPAQYLGRQEDDIIYVIASHALTQGSYRMLTSPASIPLTIAMPGLPVLLLPVTWIFGERFWAYQWFCALVMAAAPWALYAWLRRALDKTGAMLCALLFASSPLVLSQAGAVMPEIFYAAAAVPFLFAAEKSAARAGGWLLLLTQLRAAGLSLFPAALAGPILRRRWKDAAMAVGPAAAAMGLWWAWSERSSSGLQEVQELRRSYAGASWGGLIRVVLENASYYLSSWGSCHLPSAWAQGPAALVLGAGLGALALAGLSQVLRRNPAHPAAWMLLSGLLLHAAWPWHYERYLIALLPWLLWACAAAMGRKAVPVLGVLLALQLAFQTRRWLGETSWSRPELAQTYDWIKRGSAPQDILASLAFARDGFYAARPSLPLPGARDEKEFEAVLRRFQVRLVLWQDGLDLGLSLGKSSAHALLLENARAFLMDRSRYRLVYENPAEGSRVYAPR